MPRLTGCQRKIRREDENSQNFLEMADSGTRRISTHSAKRMDPLAATGLVSSMPLCSSGRKTMAPAQQGPGLPRHEPLKAFEDLAGAYRRNCWTIP